MDVSPEWWINSSKNESIVRKYICEKFECDCYPKIITFGRKKIDLEKNYEFKSILLDNSLLNLFGMFLYAFTGLTPAYKPNISLNLR